MKIFPKILQTAAVCLSTAAVLSAAERLEDVYDLFNPSQPRDNNEKAAFLHCWYSIAGDWDGAPGRVSLKQGKNPLTMKDDKGQPLMTPDPKFKTVYGPMGFSGGEDSRAFYLHGGCQISKDEWMKIVISFVPRVDGKVRFCIGTQFGWQMTEPDGQGKRKYFKYRDLRYVRVAKLECIGATFADPGFSNGKKWCGSLKYFNAKVGPATVTEQNAPSVKVLRTPLDCMQVISVKKDKPVYISWYIRSDDVFRAKGAFLDD